MFYHFRKSQRAIINYGFSKTSVSHFTLTHCKRRMCQMQYNTLCTINENIPMGPGWMASLNNEF